MSYDFYVVEGKKLVDYKPRREHYERAYLRNLEKLGSQFGDMKFADIKKIQPSAIDKTLYLLIKMSEKIKENFDKTNKEIVNLLFARISFISSLVGLYTPREFMRLFPIQKDYDGEKSGIKDYFYCMNYINEIGLDNPIGDKASEFLMEYWNRDINFYIITWMDVVSAMDIIQTGRDSMLDFFEEQGLHFHTMHQEGNYMVDDETGERHKICKSKHPIRKLFSVVE